MVSLSGVWVRGGALPSALLCVAFALALGFAPRRAIVPALLALVATALLASLANWPVAWREGAFIMCWLGVVAIATSVHLPPDVWQRHGLPTAVAFALLAGAASAAVTRFEGQPGDLARALGLGLLCFPARWLVARRFSIAIKVVASWLVAVAILAALLPLAPTPGYVPDHMQ